MNFIHVHVENEPCQTFSNIRSAIDYASRHVYISWPDGNKLSEAVQNASLDEQIHHVYGFKSVTFFKAGSDHV